MKFARYWTRRQGEATGVYRQTIEVSSRGWSDVSLEDAAARAGWRTVPRATHRAKISQ